MEIKYNHVGSNLLISITGEIDLYNVSKLKSALSDSIDDKVKNLIVDLSDISYMDSSGIGALVGAHKKMKQNGGKLSIINVQDEIMEIFRLASLHHFFNIYKVGEEGSTIPVENPSSTTFLPKEESPSPAILKKKPVDVQEKTGQQSAPIKNIPKIQFKGWVNAHTFRMPADGYGRKYTRDISVRKIESKRAAIKIAQIMTLEHFVGSFRNKNWLEFHTYRRNIYAKFSKIALNGTVKLAKFDSNQNCTIIYEVKATNLRENILSEFEKSKLPAS